MDTRSKITFRELEERVNIDEVKEIISDFKLSGMGNFFTSDIIKKYTGSFEKNSCTPAAHSFNANFGKLLKQDEGYFRIKEIRKSASTKDDSGESTHSSEESFQ